MYIPKWVLWFGGGVVITLVLRELMLYTSVGFTEAMLICGGALIFLSPPILIFRGYAQGQKSGKGMPKWGWLLLAIWIIAILTLSGGSGCLAIPLFFGVAALYGIYSFLNK